MSLDFSGRVAIVTGAGGGLGRQYALALASRGARVVVNDVGAAAGVVDEIQRAGGDAIASRASVTDFVEVQHMVADAMAVWGRIDILINNAGILRDKSFVKMDLDDFRSVLDVHLMGSVNCTKAVWAAMIAQRYGRILFTTSSSGLFGNFGQSNYAAAKMALVGLMQTLSIEGAKHGIRVNCLAPTAYTRMTEGLLDVRAAELLAPEAVVPAMLVLAHERAPNRAILCAGAGTFEGAHITLTDGVYLGVGENAAERLEASLDKVMSREGSFVPEAGSIQGLNEIEKASALRG